MSRARHKEHEKRANGGSIKADWNAGEEQNAAKEAMEKKKGGRVRHHEAEGEEGKKRMDKRARGGKMEHHEKKEHEEKHEHKKRARGGRIGSDKVPLSSAAKVKHITPGETPEDGDDKVM